MKSHINQLTLYNELTMNLLRSKALNRCKVINKQTCTMPTLSNPSNVNSAIIWNNTRYSTNIPTMTGLFESHHYKSLLTTKQLIQSHYTSSRAFATSDNNDKNETDSDSSKPKRKPPKRPRRV